MFPKDAKVVMLIILLLMCCDDCSILLLVIVVNLFLCLMYKLNFILGMHVGKSWYTQGLVLSVVLGIPWGSVPPQMGELIKSHLQLGAAVGRRFHHHMWWEEVPAWPGPEKPPR